MRAILSKLSAPRKIVVLIGIMILCSMLALLLSMPFVSVESTTNLKMIQMLQTIGVFMLPAFFSAFLFSDNSATYLRLDCTPDYISIFLCILLMIVAAPAVNLLAYLNSLIPIPDLTNGFLSAYEQQAEKLTEKLIRADSIGILCFNLIVIAALPALSEELFFRASLQPLLGESKNMHIAIWATAIIFSAIHLQFSGFIPRMLMGALFGYMAVLSGSLWLPITAHFTNNALAVVAYNVFYMQGKNIDEIDTLGTGSTLWLGIVSLIASIALATYLLLRQKSRKS